MALLASASISSSSADSDGLEQAAPSVERKLQMPLEDMLNDDYVHTHYTFNLERANMKRQGTGEFWLRFDPANDGLPHLRLRGAAHSPRFGEGDITIVVDPKKKVLHALFALGELHEAQCVTYPFPSPSDPGNSKRIELMSWRKEQIIEWMTKDAAKVGKTDDLLAVKWTAESKMEFSLTNGGKTVEGLRFSKGGKTTKYVQLQDLPDTSVGGLFDPPAQNCQHVGDVTQSLAHLELKPPHRQSSALNDFLLVLSGHPATGGKWPRLFLVLCALAVPGDVAVMIEDPVPPNPGKVGAIAFDYTAAVFSNIGGEAHQAKSEGSIWVDPAQRAFRLRGEAKKTKVGPLYMDLIARGGDDPQVYANVNLTVQEEQQCVVYPYPHKTDKSSRELTAIASQGLSFYAIDELHGEDCGVFVAPLARGHWVHIWVDMESVNPDAILRSEMHVGGKVIRSTDIRNWRTNQEVIRYLNPAPEWKCTSNPAAGQLAHLGLSEVHKRSLELRDALYAVHALDGNFAVLEVLGLTGDVAIMVQEPELPKLFEQKTMSFGFTMTSTEDGVARDELKGNFSVNGGRTTITATDARPSSPIVSVRFEPGFLAVLLEELGQEPQCFWTMGVEDTQNKPVPVAAIFDGVEAVGDTVCNRFTFLGAGAQAESVDFWYSQEEEAICKVSVHQQPPTRGPTVTFTASVGSDAGSTSSSSFRQQFLTSDDFPTPGCKPYTMGSGPSKEWLHFDSADQPAKASEKSPAVRAIAKLSQAASTVGLLNRACAEILSRLSITSPSQAASQPQGMAHPSSATVSIFDPDLKSFAFTYTSHFPLQAVGAAHPGVGQEPDTPPSAERKSGSGELRVDLHNRRMYYRGTAVNVSAGLPDVESRVIFRGDRDRMYVYTKVGDFEQCWALNSAVAVPRPVGGQQSNPFRQGKKADERVWVPGEKGALSDKYAFTLEGLQKRVQLLVSGDSALTAVNVDDLENGVSVGVLVHDWNTAPIQESVFEPNSDFHCDEPVFDEEAERLAEWDLIRIFFPGAVSVEEQQRRLVSV